MQSSSTWKLMVSKNRARMVDQVPANRNCRQLSFTPSQKAVKWSITKMCTAKHTAHTSTSRSPGAREKLPLIHSRYKDTTDSATAIHTGRLTFRRKNRPNTGTSTTYRAVMNPALPPSVPATRPACWKLEAIASTVPQQKPPSHSCLRWAFFFSGVTWGRSFLKPLETARTTSRDSTAM